MKTLVATIVLYVLCLFLDGYSSGHFLMLTIPMLLLTASLATLLLSVWTTGSFWQRQLKASKTAFPLAAIVFLMGYFYDTLKVML